MGAYFLTTESDKHNVRLLTRLYGNTHTHIYTYRVHCIHTHPRHVGNCYSSLDHGQSYTGHVATTQRGEHCQSWDEPHLLFHPRLYSELDGASNLCRNPGQLKDRIWCFTSESAWDYCSIPNNCSEWSVPSEFTRSCTYIVLYHIIPH